MAHSEPYPKYPRNLTDFEKMYGYIYDPVAGRHACLSL